MLCSEYLRSNHAAKLSDSTDWSEVVAAMRATKKKQSPPGVGAATSAGSTAETTATTARSHSVATANVLSDRYHNHTEHCKTSLVESQLQKRGSDMALSSEYLSLMTRSPSCRNSKKNLQLLERNEAATLRVDHATLRAILVKALEQPDFEDTRIQIFNGVNLTIEECLALVQARYDQLQLFQKTTSSASSARQDWRIPRAPDILRDASPSAFQKNLQKIRKEGGYGQGLQSSSAPECARFRYGSGSQQKAASSEGSQKQVARTKEGSGNGTKAIVPEECHSGKGSMFSTQVGDSKVCVVTTERALTQRGELKRHITTKKKSLVVGCQILRNGMRQVKSHLSSEQKAYALL